VKQIVSSCGLQAFNHTILFSTRRFKQRGASYTPPADKKIPAGLIKLKATADTAP